MDRCDPSQGKLIAGRLPAREDGSGTEKTRRRVGVFIGVVSARDDPRLDKKDAEIANPIQTKRAKSGLA